jgi:hypothetical protein
MQKTKDIPTFALGVAFMLRRSVASALGVVSRLRRVKSKAPALQNIRCKAGALLLARRSVDATPSGGHYEYHSNDIANTILMILRIPF